MTPATDSPLLRLAKLGPLAVPTVLREQLYLLLVAGISLVSVLVVYVTLVVSPFAVITVIGIPVLLALVGLEVQAARGLGAAHRGLLASLFGVRIDPPPRLRPRPGWGGWVRSTITDSVGWRSVAHVMLTSPLKIAGLWLTIMGWVSGVITVTYPFWWAAFGPRNTDDQGRVHHSGIQFGNWFADSVPKALLVAAVGLAMLWVVPWIARGIVALDRVAMPAFLGPGVAERRVAEADERRVHAVEDSAAALRRVERDLHDGAQARLVAVAMQLDMARERLADGDDPDPAATLALVEQAHRNATDAIAELREVTRSIHPPALDRGLDTALATLAARSPVPVQLRVDVPPSERPSPAVETIAYFCVAELLTNVAKHSGARRAALDVTATGGWLRLQVTDDGAGGATVAPGRGLAGLSSRVGTVYGRITVQSPAGGPTVVTVDLPVRG
jgi:signal transduction histidine kinase